MIGEIIVYDYAAPAISCCWNGRRIRGIARIAGFAAEGWIPLDNGIRVRSHEILLRRTHPFRPNASGFGCVLCGFNADAEVHA